MAGAVVAGAGVGAERTLVAWYPDWAVVAAGYPSDVAVAVVASNRVVACSVGARAEGVVCGLRRREAQGRCPELVVVAADPCRDQRAWEPVVAAVEQLCPKVEVGEAGMVALPTRGPSRYFGGDGPLATQVAVVAGTAVAALGLPAGPGVRVGVADGRFCAALAARSAPPATGAVVVEVGKAAQWLAPLPLDALDRPELTDLWGRLGLRTLGALAALAERDVLARFGVEGVAAHRLARGLDGAPPSARVVPPDLTVSTELDPPAERVDIAAFVGKGLADELHERLGAMGLACTRVAVEAETEHGERLERLWRHDGALSAGAIAERVRWQLDGWLRAQGGPGGRTSGGLTLLRLRPDEVHPDGRQLGFWGAPAGDEARMGRSLARVQGLLGPAAVVTAVLGGGRDAADQVRLVPWGEPRQSARPAAWAPSGTPGGPGSRPPLRRPGRSAAAVELPPWPGRVPGPAPSVVHDPMLPAQVCDGAGGSVVVTGRGSMSAPPASVAVGGGPALAVTAWAGPWPVEERWWDAGGRRRARLQVTLEDGSAHLLDREGGSWGIGATWD